MLSLEFLVLLLDALLVVAYFILVRAVDYAPPGEPPRPPSAQPEAFWIVAIFWGYLAWDVLAKVVIRYRRRLQSSRWQWLKDDLCMLARMVPTLVCLFLAYEVKQWVQGADAPHVLTADLALLALVLLFRALKDLGSRRGWIWAVSLSLLMFIAVLWTRRSWPIPRSVVVAIQTAPSER